MSYPYSEEYIVRTGLDTVDLALTSIHERTRPGKHGLDELWYKRLKKWLLMVDHDAQLTAEEYLETQLTGIQIQGEESTLDTFSGGLSALLDMLDGSDLLKRNLGNWCSAATIFDSDTAKVITALVGMPNREIYFTQNSNSTCAFVRTPRGTSGYEISEVRMARREVTVEDASLCFYGQKPGRLSSFSNSNNGMGRRLKEISELMEAKKEDFDCPKMRIYTLAGNPMMINLVEGRVDAVIELSGQKCHDVVPGFIIALRSGAVLKDFSNEDITEEQIVSSLRDPKLKFSYVLACSKRLATELVMLLQPTMSLIR